MSTDGIWQDSKSFKDSELVKKWKDMLHTVEASKKQLENQKQVLLKRKKDIEKAKETNNG
tara:strand:- start:841 stop:1020 length:180 start_codon:yes stop_codon:yes gene_type:complete